MTSNNHFNYEKELKLKIIILFKCMPPILQQVSRNEQWLACKKQSHATLGRKTTAMLNSKWRQ